MKNLYQRTKRWLRRKYPVEMRLRVYTRDAKSEQMLGVAGWFVPVTDDHGVIYISRGIDGHMAETLIEEWCHAMRHAAPLPVDYDGEPHDALFWSIYGEVTNAWRSKFFKRSGRD